MLKEFSLWGRSVVSGKAAGSRQTRASAQGGRGRRGPRARPWALVQTGTRGTRSQGRARACREGTKDEACGKEIILLQLEFLLVLVRI